MNTTAKFRPDRYYHVYNRTNNKETLFKEPENRDFFLTRFNHYIRPFCYVHSYALMSNHFHFSIKLKPISEIVDIAKKTKGKVSNKMKNFMVAFDDESFVEETFNTLMISQFQNFFNSYAKSINKKYNRVGSLFQKGFKRSEYTPENKFLYLQYYIHHNARKHRLVKDFKDYPHHSYFEILAMNSQYIDVENVIEEFGSLAKFQIFHDSIQYEDKFRNIDLDRFV